MIPTPRDRSNGGRARRRRRRRRRRWRRGRSVGPSRSDSVSVGRTRSVGLGLGRSDSVGRSVSVGRGIDIAIDHPWTYATRDVPPPPTGDTMTSAHSKRRPRHSHAPATSRVASRRASNDGDFANVRVRARVFVDARVVAVAKRASDVVDVVVVVVVIAHASTNDARFGDHGCTHRRRRRDR